MLGISFKTLFNKLKGYAATHDNPSQPHGPMER